MTNMIKNADGTEYATPFAVICNMCGPRCLTDEQYISQSEWIDAKWFCPVCGGSADWDDFCPETNPAEEPEEAA